MEHPSLKRGPLPSVGPFHKLSRRKGGVKRQWKWEVYKSACIDKHPNSQVMETIPFFTELPVSSCWVYIYIYLHNDIYIYKDVVSPYCFHPFSKNTGLWFLWKIRLWILARFHLWDLSSSVPGAKTGSNSNENEKFLNHHLSISTQIQKLWKQSHS